MFVTPEYLCAEQAVPPRQPAWHGGAHDADSLQTNRRPMRLTVRLTPRGGRDQIEGWASDAAGRPCLKVRVAASPVDGQANAALARLIAKALGKPPSAVRIISGDTSRLKQIEIQDIEPSDLALAFPHL